MTLHITNGDSAAELLRAIPVEGRVLPWRESWLDGPAAVRWELPAAASERGAWMERTLGVPRELYESEHARQLAELEAAAEAGEEIVLWFEYDLFDQTILAALLHWLARYGHAGRWEEEDDRPRSSRGGESDRPPLRLSWIIVESVPGIADFRGLGQLTAGQLAELRPLRQPVEERLLAAGARAWEAYASPSPAAIANWLDMDGAVLPVMAKALRTHLDRFPTQESGGIGVVERLTVRLLAERQDDGRSAGSAASPEALFGAVSGALPTLGMGDLSYWAVLNRLADGSSPLLRIEGPPLPDFHSQGPVDWRQWRIGLTEYGSQTAAVLADVDSRQDGEAGRQGDLGRDYVPAAGSPANGIVYSGPAYWLGGVLIE